MKRLILILAMVLISTSSFAGDKRTTIYDSKGHNIGYMRDDGKTTRVYNSEGTYQGRTTTYSNKSKTLWGPSGEYLGHATCTGGCDPQNRGEDE